MAKRIITISRAFGSGGRFMGKEVAKKTWYCIFAVPFLFLKSEV